MNVPFVDSNRKSFHFGFQSFRRTFPEIALLPFESGITRLRLFGTQRLQRNLSGTKKQPKKQPTRLSGSLVVSLKASWVWTLLSEISYSWPLLAVGLVHPVLYVSCMGRKEFESRFSGHSSRYSGHYLPNKTETARLTLEIRWAYRSKLNVFNVGFVYIKQFGCSYAVISASIHPSN